jgi:hypothetical protein
MRTKKRPMKEAAMLRRMITAAFACGVLLGAATPSPAQVNINLGINLPARPQLVAVPTSPVQYAPNVDANYFFYDGEYYVFTNGRWYISRSYNGPWALLEPEFIPMPVLQVPVRYYHRPPAQWRAWHREAPPRWAPAWGRRWEERRHVGQASPRWDDRRDDRRDRDDRHDDHRDRHDRR